MVHAPWKIVALLGFCHAASDCTAGYLLGGYGFQRTWYDSGAMLLLYNVLAFGGQLPWAVWIDRNGWHRSALSISLVMMALSMVLVGSLDGDWVMPLAVLIAGNASALFHVSGGGVVLHATQGNAGAAGLFAGPGVIGLALGGWLAWQSWEVHLILAAVLILAWLVQSQLEIQSVQLESGSQEQHGLDHHDWAMLLVLLIIAMRSAIWTMWEQIMHGDYEMWFSVAVAASFGKILGGFLAQRWGLGCWMLVALASSSLMLQFGESNSYLMLGGVALLQSSTGPALSMLSRILPRQPATASAMGLGLAIAAGGLPFLLGWEMNPNWTMPVLVVGLLLLGLLARFKSGTYTR